jgi:hypothetical protein
MPSVEEAALGTVVRVRSVPIDGTPVVVASSNIERIYLGFAVPQLGSALISPSVNVAVDLGFSTPSDGTPLEFKSRDSAALVSSEWSGMTNGVPTNLTVIEVLLSQVR